jgi:hypothetical protein
MAVKFSNNASGTIASSINSTTTTIVLTSGQGSLFPSLGASDYFFATLVDSSNNLEIVKVTARSTDTMTVVRGQDGTSGRSYTAGDRFELRPVAAAFNGIQAEIDDIEAAIAANYAPLVSPAFTGVPTAPTASAGTNTTQVATTAFTKAAIDTATASLGTLATQNADNVAITGGSITGITDLTVSDGGTGRSTLTANNLVVGNGTSAVNFVAPGASGQVLTSNGTSWASAAPADNSIGVGQTWQSVSRSIGTTYTNSTGRPIQVSVSTSTNQFGTIRFSINGTIVSSIAGGDFGNHQAWNFIIPPGATYLVTTTGSGSSVSSWWELR